MDHADGAPVLNRPVDEGLGDELQGERSRNEGGLEADAECAECWRQHQ